MAWPASMRYEVHKAAKGWWQSMVTGEGLVLKFTGPGTIYMQTRNEAAFGAWVRQFAPPPSQN